MWRDDQLIGEQLGQGLEGKDAAEHCQEKVTKPGLHRYEAAIEARRTLAENNRALGFTRVQGKPTVLIVEGEPRDGRFLAEALRGSG